MLLPHRTENELMDGYASAQEAFPAKTDRLDQTINFMFISLTNEIENAIRRIRMCEAELSYAVDDSSCETIPDNLPSMSTNGLTNFEKHCETSINITKGTDEATLHLHTLESCSLSHDKFYQWYKLLFKDQKAAIDFVKSQFRDNITLPFHFFITGVAGTEKSYILEIIIAYLQLFTSSQMGNLPVVVCAPTGTAARNIGSTTIHSLLQIPVSQYNEYIPLSDFALSKLQRKFKVIKTIVIDEISMVSDKMLTYISWRLSEIKNNDSPFGNMNVIAVEGFFQLRPVNGKFAFCNKLLWNLFKPIFLQQNMRQSNDQQYARPLNRARVGCLSESDISILLG